MDTALPQKFPIIYWEYFRFSVVSLGALWPYPSSGIILSIFFIISNLFDFIFIHFFIVSISIFLILYFIEKLSIYLSYSCLIMFHFVSFQIVSYS